MNDSSRTAIVTGSSSGHGRSDGFEPDQDSPTHHHHRDGRRPDASSDAGLPSFPYLGQGRLPSVHRHRDGAGAPIRRAARPRRGVGAFLAAPDALWTTGPVCTLDGGSTAK